MSTAPTPLSDDDVLLMKRLGGDFTSHPASRGIDDIEKAGDLMTRATAHAAALAQRVADMTQAFQDTRDVLAATKGEVERLRAEIRGKSDAAYCRYIETLRTDACLGWEHKVKTRKFGEAELKAHTKAAEYFGMHRAYADFLNNNLAPAKEPTNG